MNDRDRLAADLHPSVCGPHDHAFVPDGKRACQLAANRLVALGWHVHTQGEVHVETLDEERLARALNSLAIPDEWLLRDRTPFAASVAKAYREDTDA